jgi:hypothetical protein
MRVRPRQAENRDIDHSGKGMEIRPINNTAVELLRVKFTGAKGSPGLVSSDTGGCLGGPAGS